MKTLLIIVRHAEAEGNYKRVFHGWTDSVLTEKGHIQAQKVAERLVNQKIDILYSSSMKRTLQTAEYISKIKNLPIVRTDKLKEINGGDWEGKSWLELPEKWPDEYVTWENSPHLHVMPNGEAMTDFRDRLAEEIDRIVDKNTGKNICIVTHGTAIKALTCYFTECKLEEMLNIPWVDNTSVSIIEHENGKYKVIEKGDSSHLEKKMSTIKNQGWYEEHIKNIYDK